MNCEGCFDDDCDEAPRRDPMFELVYDTASCLVGPCSGEDRDELIKLWGREPDAGRVL